MIGGATVQEVLRGALRGAEGDESELVLSAGRREATRCANSTIHQNVSTEDAQVTARVVRDGRIGVAIAHGFSAEACGQALREAGELATFAPRDPAFRGLPAGSSVGTYPTVRCHFPETAATDPAARATALGRVFTAAGRSGLTVAGSFTTTEKELAVVNSRGVSAYAPVTSAVVNLIALGDDGSGFATDLSRNIADVDVDAVGETARRKCMEAQGARDVEPGEYEVILEPTATAELLEWFSFTSLTARSVHEKTSSFAGKLGEPVTGPRVVLVDDGTDAAGVPIPFDFEGMPKQRLVLLDGGVARGFAVDSVWSARMDRPSTGHAIPRGGDTDDPVPTNLFVGAGDVPEASMVSRMERGLLVTRFHYVNGFLDTRRSLMTGMTRDGTFLVEKGRVVGPVRNLRFTQSFLEALEDVRAVSVERRRIPSWWGSAFDSGAMTVPTLHLGRFKFTGQSRAD